MLRYENPSDDVSLTTTKVANATRTLAQAALINVAAETGLELHDDSYRVYTDQVDRVIDDPEIVMSPGDLVRHAEAYALRGAQAMVADGESRFHEGTWSHRGVCPLWPFC